MKSIIKHTKKNCKEQQVRNGMDGLVCTNCGAKEKTAKYVSRCEVGNFVNC